MKTKQGTIQHQSATLPDILIVEDNESALEASAGYLARLGYQPRAAATATEARALAAERPPEIAICDWGLGGTESGVDVARFLQQKFGTRLIFVTAQPRAALRAAVRDLEVERVLQKPISLRVLAGIVRSLHD